MVWKNQFRKLSPDTDIPICPVENNPLQLQHNRKGEPIYMLRDGTPYLEDLMYHIFLLIDNSKAPIAFLAMATDIIKDAEKQATQLEKLVQSSPESETIQENNVSTISKSEEKKEEPKKSKKDKINGRDKALNNAAERAMKTNEKDDGSWCLLL